MPRAHCTWTPEEEQILRRLYPAGGVRACERALPERSHNAIVSRIGFLVLRLNPGAHQRLTREAIGGPVHRATLRRLPGETGLDDRELRLAFERIDRKIRESGRAGERESETTEARA